jgi:hypothetical protein
MSNKSNKVDIGPMKAGKVVEQEYCGALLVNEFACAPLMKRRIEVI